jgi:hypothetical protein
MQLGKLGTCQHSQALSCKTADNCSQFHQWLTSEKQNQQLLDLIVQRDDGMFALGWHDDAPAFPSLRFAEAAALTAVPA